MQQPSKQSLIDASVVAWILDGKFVTENRKPVEFVRHRFFIDYLADNHHDKVSCKAGQVGATVMESFDDFHLAGKQGLNVIHTLHTNDVIKGFVTPKVNPLITLNPRIEELRKSDSENLKQFGFNYIYYRGANAESQAISISADVLKIDELDRSNAKVVEMFQSRLDFSAVRRFSRFSNPSAIGAGVDALFSESDQRHWFVRCSHCNHYMFLDFFANPEHQNHYVDQERAIFACGSCHKEIYDADRIRGEWVAKYPTRADHRHGYWFSQCMVTWFSARDIITKYKDNSPEYFNNFVLGKAYTPSDLLVDRKAILRACSPGTISLKNVCMGVDNGIVKHYVIGTPDGIFRYGKTEDWEEIRSLIRLYDMKAVVIDANPFPLEPRRLVKEFRGKVFTNYYVQDRKQLGTIQWGTGKDNGVVKSDRTKILDQVANEIANADITFRQSPYELEEFIGHCANVYRTVTENVAGIRRGEWITQEGKPDHLFHAMAYWRIAMERAYGSFGRQVDTSPAPKPDGLVADGGKITPQWDLNKAYSDAQNRTIRR